MNGILKCVHILNSFKDESRVCLSLLNNLETINRIHKVLKPLYQATIVLQMEDFTLSDFYSTWLQVEKKLQKISIKEKDQLAIRLLHTLGERKIQLIEKPAMICALALDPRFCTDLEDEKKKVATDLLLDLWRRAKSIENDTQSIELSDSESSADDDISIASTTQLKKYVIEKRPDGSPINIFELSEKITSFIST